MNLLHMQRAVDTNPIGMTDKDIAVSYWLKLQSHNLRVAFLNLALNT